MVGGELAESKERSTVTEEMEVIETESDSTSVVEEQVCVNIKAELYIDYSSHTCTCM